LSLTTKLNSLDYSKAHVTAEGALLQTTGGPSEHHRAEECLMLKLGGNLGAVCTPNSSSYDNT